MDTTAATPDTSSLGPLEEILLPDAGSASPRAPTLDTLALKIDLGGRFDVTNESYYEDAFVDTTFLGRRLVGTPEERQSAVVSAILAGTRGARRTQFQLQGEVAEGELLQREQLHLSWRSRLGSDLTLSMDPRVEHRRDRTLGRDLEEWRAAAGTRLRRGFGEGLTHGELSARADVLRTEGGDDVYVLDRQSGTLGAGLEHLGLLGNEWRAAYRLAARAFPDSAERDHLEHQAEGRWKAHVGAGSVSLDVLGGRRVTVRDVPTSRDNFSLGEAALEGSLQAGDSWNLTARAGVELTRYDVEDSTLFFDYHVLRGQALVRHERGARWTVALGPRCETLTARLSPGDGYQEIAGVLQLERLGAGSWWSVNPAVGWRDYDETAPGASGTAGLHSSFAFYEVDAIADQALFGRWRLRAIAALRWERHVDPAHDARSVFASTELLWAWR